jgi:three-Cys-motif partner protein
VSRRAQLQPTLWRIDPHTTIKHLVYRHYLACWMAKVCQKFPEAAIVDGFAGPGEYECGADGSTIIVAKLFLEHGAAAKFKHLYVLAQEFRRDRVEHLIRKANSLRHDPRLHIDVRDPASFTDERATLSTLAHGDTGKRPVLWLLDPYNWDPVPFEVVVACLRAGRDEMLLTFFVDEVYRFRRSDAHADAISRYLGVPLAEWGHLRDIRKEDECKQAIIELYCRNLSAATGVMTGHFSIAVKNQTPRYAVVFATHNKAGLQCWNPVTWRLDERGGAIKAMKPEQLDMFVPGCRARPPARDRLADAFRWR